MNPQSPSHRVTVGTVRLSLTTPKRGNDRPTITAERRSGSGESDWYPAATFTPDDLPMLAGAIQHMRDHLQGPPPKGNGSKPPQSTPQAPTAPSTPPALAQQPPFVPNVPSPPSPPKRLAAKARPSISPTRVSEKPARPSTAVRLDKRLSAKARGRPRVERSR